MAIKPFISSHENPIKAKKEALFFIASPLHLICAEAIVSTLRTETTCRLFYLKPDLESIIKHKNWSSVDYLPWPRHFPLPGLFGRYRRIIENAKTVENKCKEATDISLYMPVIDSEAYNYNICISRQILHGRDPDVNLIPDGLLNIKRHSQGKTREYSKYFRKLRKIFTPWLDYYIYKGDRTGADASIVKKIYTLPNTPHEYDTNKAHEISFPKEQQNTLLSNTNKALIIGQPLTSYNILTKDNLNYLTEALNNFLIGNDITETDYKAHPRDKINELYTPNYNKISPDEPLETYLIKNPYKIIISIYSTALFLSRILSSTNSRCVSFGIDLVDLTSNEEKTELINLFKKNKIEIIFSGKKAD